MTQATETGAE